jgi:enoyl-CoA hydratase
VPIRYEKDDHIVLITIDRYEKRNSFDLEHAEAMIESWIRFRDDPDAWVAIVTGVKNVFCAGGDLNTMRQIAKETAETGHSETKDRINGYGKGSVTLRGFNIYKPILAAVNGYCMAGGMELLGGTDIRIASTEAVFSITEPRRGLFAGGGTTARLPRQLSWPAAMEMLLVAGNVSADRALQLGLVNEVVAPEDLLPAAMRWAKQITRNAPLAVQGTKKSALLGFAAATLEDAYRIEDQCAEEVFSTEDAQEGASAFLEKREPTWRGR